jgi:hypothetical protein
METASWQPDWIILLPKTSKKQGATTGSTAAACCALVGILNKYKQFVLHEFSQLCVSHHHAHEEKLRIKKEQEQGSMCWLFQPGVVFCGFSLKKEQEKCSVYCSF